MQRIRDPRSLSRRSLLKLGAVAGACTLFLPRTARAQQACGDGPLVISIEAQNAWDPTFLCDPKASDGAFTPWTPADVRTVAGISYAPNLLTDGTKTPYLVGGEDFFVKHGSKLLVVNGVDNATVSHDIGPRVAFAGSNREGIPTLSGLVAAARGATLPMSLLTTGGFVNTEGLVPITRAGDVDVLLALAKSNVPNAASATSTRKFMDGSVFTMVRDRVRLRDQRRIAGAAVPREFAGLSRVAPARAAGVVDAFDALAPAFQAADDVASANPVIPKAAAVMAAMKAGACVAAHLETDESFDTHDNHDIDHPVSMQQMLEIIDFVIGEVESSPALMDRGVVLVMGSDFGRTKYNDDGGKDHWPITSMMIAGLGAASAVVEGGRTVGGTRVPTGGNGLAALHVKDVDGEVVTTEDDDPEGIVLTAGHVHLALREALGFCPDQSGDLSARFPLTNVTPQLPLPILKRT